MQVRSSQIGHEDVVAVGIAVPAEMLDFVLALVARPVESRIEWIIGDKLIQSEDAGVVASAVFQQHTAIHAKSSYPLMDTIGRTPSPASERGAYGKDFQWSLAHTFLELIPLPLIFLYAINSLWPIPPVQSHV